MISHPCSLEGENEATGFIMLALKEIYQQCCPLKSVKMSNKDPIYMNPLVKHIPLKKSKYQQRGQLKQAEETWQKIERFLGENVCWSNKNTKGSVKSWKEIKTLTSKKKTTTSSDTFRRDWNQWHFFIHLVYREARRGTIIGHNRAWCFRKFITQHLSGTMKILTGCYSKMLIVYQNRFVSTCA